MTLSCDIYKGVNKVGSGKCKPGSLVIDAYVPFLDRAVGTGRGVIVKTTDGQTEPKEWHARIEVNGGTFLALTEPCPD